MKLKLLVFELWGMGDLGMATPFLRAAAERFEVVLLAKPIAREMQPLLWPGLEVIPADIPWTAFRGKYDLIRWNWRAMAALVKRLRSCRFDIAASARWDPRDHFLLGLTGAKRRVGYPRMGGGLLLTDRMVLPDQSAPYYEQWRVLGRHLGIDLPPREKLPFQTRDSGTVLIHTGALRRQRVWPLERYQELASQLRESQYKVQIACDPAQREWWISRGESVRVPASIPELITLIDGAGLYVGNDSGPGHLAAMRGVPTFSIFGNQFPNRFAPVNPVGEWIEGSPCPYKPCWDSCRFANPECLWAISASDAWAKLKVFAEKHLHKNPAHLGGAAS
jgi:heptosyltransferase-2